MVKESIKALLRPLYRHVAKPLLRPVTSRIHSSLVSGLEERVRDLQENWIPTLNHHIVEVSHRVEELKVHVFQEGQSVQDLQERLLATDRLLLAFLGGALRQTEDRENRPSDGLEIADQALAPALLREALNKEFSYKGSLAKHGLWINQGISLAYDCGLTPEVTLVNERVAEVPFVLRHIPVDARLIVDLGSAESILPLQIASSTRAEVTAVDLRDFPFQHTQLHFRRADLRELPFKEGSFEAAVCLSTIEHVGLGHYGDPIDPDGDAKALRETHRVLTPSGKLIGTFPLGSGAITEVHRLYQPDHILGLLGRYFTHLEVRYAKRDASRGQWLYSDAAPPMDPNSSDVQAVLLYSGAKK